MNPVDEVAHLIQISVAPVFLLTGVGTVLNVLSGRLARIVDRARLLEERFKTHALSSEAATLNELQILRRRGHLIHRAITLSTFSALMVCLLIASLFASALLHYPIHVAVIGLFVFAMLASIASLIYFLREVFLHFGPLTLVCRGPRQNRRLIAASKPPRSEVARKLLQIVDSKFQFGTQKSLLILCSFCRILRERD